MRLSKYLSYSNTDDDLNLFRSMRISLTDKPQDHSLLLKSLYEKYKIEPIEPILNSLNKELRSFYNGKYIYDLCLEPKKKIDDLRPNKRKKEHITLALFEANDKLSKIKSLVELQLKDCLHTTDINL